MQTAAKSALGLPHDKVGVPIMIVNININHYILSTWQNDWNDAVANKLHFVKSVLGDWEIGRLGDLQAVQER